MKITDYHFGQIAIDGQACTSDVIITPEGVEAGWWRQEGHRLAITDLYAVVDARPDIVVIGAGYAGRMQVPEATRAYLEAKGIRVRVSKTRDAVEAFNALQQQYARVVAALHLSC